MNGGQFGGGASVSREPGPRMDVGLPYLVPDLCLMPLSRGTLGLRRESRVVGVEGLRSVGGYRIEGVDTDGDCFGIANRGGVPNQVGTPPFLVI